MLCRFCLNEVKENEKQANTKVDTALWGQTCGRLSRLLNPSQYIRVKTHKTKREKLTISQNRQNVFIDSE